MILSFSFTGIKPMGLFWSVVPKVGQRLFKKDVETPLKYEMKVYNGQLLAEMDSVQQEPIASTIVDRWFKKSSIRRIPLVNEQFKGTIFLPEGMLISVCATRVCTFTKHSAEVRQGP